MHDSLINRFRGAFLGTWLGESAALPQLQRPAWSLQALAATDRLGCEGVQAQPDVQTQFKLLPDLLPIALLYHDQPQQLQQMLRAAQAASGLGSGLEGGLDSSEPAAVIGQIISLILRERFVASELIPQVIRDLDLHPPLVQELLQVQDWLTQPADLAAVAQGLKGVDSPQPPELLAVALYCFLSSPDDFQISLRRLQRLIAQAPDRALAGVILGAISGLYGGLLSLPMNWQNQSWQNEQRENSSDVNWAANWELRLFQRADWLLTRWSGASSGASSGANMGQWLQQPHTSLVAAPRVIQPRRRLSSSILRGG